MIDHAPDALPPSIAALPQEVRDAMGHAIASAIVDAIEELITETRAQAEIAGMPYDDAARAIRSRADREGISLWEAAMVRGKELRGESTEDEPKPTT